MIIRAFFCCKTTLVSRGLSFFSMMNIFCRKILPVQLFLCMCRLHLFHQNGCGSFGARAAGIWSNFSCWNWCALQKRFACRNCLVSPVWSSCDENGLLSLRPLLQRAKRSDQDWFKNLEMHAKRLQTKDQHTIRIVFREIALGAWPTWYTRPDMLQQDVFAKRLRGVSS